MFKRISTKTKAAVVGMLLAVSAGTLFAQQPANEQFVPVLVYRTGAYAPNGAPWANGFIDYLKLVNERDGGVGGVKITYEECEFGYATDRGVECYERLKGKGPTGASVFNPLSTGVTFALTDKAPVDKIPIMTMGYGRADSADGSVFQWNFPLLGTYWSAADMLVQHVNGKDGGLKGKKIALIYHDSPYGKEPIAVLDELARKHGYELMKLPVTHPGVEQKSTWLQVRQSKPDYIFLWGWGVMNAAAIKEAIAINYPREKMYGVWWAGAEPDVLPAEGGAKGYNALALQHSSGMGKAHQDIMKFVYNKGNGTGKKEEVGQVLYNRGMINSMLVIESIRAAQAKFGKKPLTGEQVRAGIESLNLDQAAIDKIGLGGFMQPVKVTCANHEGAHKARIHQWNGSSWNYVTDWMTADDKFLRGMVEESAKKYAKEKNITATECKAA